MNIVLTKNKETGLVDGISMLTYIGHKPPEDTVTIMQVLSEVLTRIRKLENPPDKTDAAETPAPKDPVYSVVNEIIAEYRRAERTWPPYNSAHEGLGVLMEEFDELKAHVYMKQSKRDLPAMKKEAIQVAAVALRFALQVCDETRGRV